MLDPEINFFRAAQPLAQRWLKDGQGSLIDGAIKLGRQLIGLPQRLDGVLNQLEQGQLRVDMRRLERQLQRMETTQRRRDMVIVALVLVVGYFALK
jgi:predicted unusual protein kinase regulating ubiquinone biosynthesis (AarF/ABC1/UbiB family)